MWALDNHTPFAAERSWVRDKNGSEVWVVAVKGTFTINSNETLTLAQKQEEVCATPKYLGEPGKSSLLYDSDLFHMKLTTDIILHGHAYAPKGKPTTQVDVTMKVGSLEKTLRVFGDRYWKKNLVGIGMTEPEPFKKMPIIYERAYGGVDKKSINPEKHGWECRNPIGMGFAVETEHLIGQRIPNVEDPKVLISSWKQRPRPAGFGPIAGNWSPRLELAGTYDENWEKQQFPLLPNDFNERFYLCAPEDQQAPSYLKGGELVELHNLTPEGKLSFNLPHVVLEYETHFLSKEIIPHRAVLHTVILEPDALRIMMVWHTTLECHPKVLKLEETVINQKRYIQFVQGKPVDIGAEAGF